VTDNQRRSPLVGFADEFAELSIRTGGRLGIAERPYLRQLNVRARADAIDTAATALGVPLPTAPNRVGRAGDVAALWLGPDEWLVVGGSGGEPSPDGWGVVDVSAQRTVIVLSGPQGVGLLPLGCALDLGRLTLEWCAQTMLARANVILWGTHPEEIHILVRLSFAPYLAAWLLDAATVMV
jgi:sarcosine oxidase subunit gamma